MVKEYKPKPITQTDINKVKKLLKITKRDQILLQIYIKYKVYFEDVEDACRYILTIYAGRPENEDM